MGRLSKPQGPANPGEWDYRSHLLDDRMTAQIRVVRSAAGVTRLEEGWRGTLFGWLAVVRGWGTRALQAALPRDEAGLAAALLLGDGTAMDREEWDVFVRTGKKHGFSEIAETPCFIGIPRSHGFHPSHRNGPFGTDLEHFWCTKSLRFDLLTE